MALTERADAGRPGTVYVVDDDAGIRDAMQTLFASVSLPVRTYASAQAFLDDPAVTSPGCLVSDLRMPGMSGLELQEQLARKPHSLPVIFLSGHGNLTAAVRAMRAGAAHFLTKPVDEDALIEAVREALRRDLHDRDEAQIQQDAKARLESLTRREYEVMEGVVDGLSSKEIARRLGISFRTVELHRSHLMEKTGARSIAPLVQLYIAAQSPPPPPNDR